MSIQCSYILNIKHNKCSYSAVVYWTIDIIKDHTVQACIEQ